MSPAGPAGQAPGALAGLPPLAGAQWRCLRVVSETGDLAHAARKLHWSQAVLRAVLGDLQASLGSAHVRLAGRQVLLSPSLAHLVRQRAPCPPPGEPASAGPPSAQGAGPAAAKSLAQR